jgi:hypothetical protein
MRRIDWSLVINEHPIIFSNIYRQTLGPPVEDDAAPGDEGCLERMEICHVLRLQSCLVIPKVSAQCR